MIPQQFMYITVKLRGGGTYAPKLAGVITKIKNLPIDTHTPMAVSIQIAKFKLR